MDIFDRDIILFWKALSNKAVKYLMIGGFATNIHGFQRFTGDIDIWIEDTMSNRINLRQAFNAVGMGDFAMIEQMQFVPGWTDFQLNNGLKLDVVTTMAGLEAYTFDECLGIATLATIEDTIVPFLHINQLIANKKSVNRAKDQIDVIELEKIKMLREQMGLD